MALIKCEECGKEISDKAKSCPNCGCPISDIGKLIIYGYKETFLINTDIKVYKNKNLVGKIGNNGIMQLDIEKDCTIEFKTMFRSAKYDAKANKLQKIILSWDRFSGKLKVNRIDNV